MWIQWLLYNFVWRCRSTWAASVTFTTSSTLWRNCGSCSFTASRDISFFLKVRFILSNRAFSFANASSSCLISSSQALRSAISWDRLNKAVCDCSFSTSSRFLTMSALAAFESWVSTLCSSWILFVVCKSSFSYIFQYNSKILNKHNDSKCVCSNEDLLRVVLKL